MYNKIRFVPALLAALVAAGAVHAADKPVAVVNGVSIPQEEMDFILKHQTEQGAQDTPELRAKIRDFLVTQEIIAQEAAKEGLDKTADFQMEAKLAHADLLRNTLFASYVKNHPISDDAMKAEYDKQVAGMGQQKEYHARHILVKTEAEANAILASLKKGKSFEALAKEKSQDEGSKANGGDLGWAQPDRYVKEFGEALTHLAKGQTTDKPVKSQFGYHIIRLEDARVPAPPPLDQVKGQLQQMMQRQQIDTLVNDLKGKAKVD
ncbi:MAG: peptidylprolyl isomerase [Burkholderiales bacterium]|nr:peptidylprolyl isomerase [Burkholderiales bacterium]